MNVQTLAGTDAQILAVDLGNACSGAVHVVSAVLDPSPETRVQASGGRP